MRIKCQTALSGATAQVAMTSDNSHILAAKPFQAQCFPRTNLAISSTSGLGIIGNTKPK
jgi:hypothetical protein